DDHDQ
ncbi:hypothetical protein A2U01_0010228, partial [Trifolium medium]